MSQFTRSPFARHVRRAARELGEIAAIVVAVDVVMVSLIAIYAWRAGLL